MKKKVVNTSGVKIQPAALICGPLPNVPKPKKTPKHNASGLGKKIGTGPYIEGLDMTKNPTWFRVMDEGTKGMVLGEEVIIHPGMDFPLGLASKPVVIVQHGGAPSICKIVAIDEITQTVKIEMFLQKERPSAWILGTSIFRAFEILWYCGPDQIPKPVQSIMKLQAPQNMDFLRPPVTAEETKTLKSMEAVNDYLKGMHKNGFDETSNSFSCLPLAGLAYSYTF